MSLLWWQRESTWMQPKTQSPSGWLRALELWKAPQLVSNAWKSTWRVVCGEQNAHMRALAMRRKGDSRYHPIVD